MAFTAAVVVNVAAQMHRVQELWIGLMAFVPLGLLLLTGLYMFVLPYAARRRNGRPS
jgi:hypothetical protein